jgi:hypothetical protein
LSSVLPASAQVANFSSGWHDFGLSIRGDDDAERGSARGSVSLALVEILQFFSYQGEPKKSV